MERGEQVDWMMSFTANDLFRVTSTNASARSYTSLKASLNRLQGTHHHQHRNGAVKDRTAPSRGCRRPTSNTPSCPQASVA
jgi:plasmid replication initiation protein